MLDEAHHIKNFRSQRWQTLLNFNSKRRLLLTGTPLQNNLMELWSLLHFLMPHIFESHKEFKDWFSNPVTGMIEGTETVNQDVIERLHKILRPFLLRRLKKDVEKSLKDKIEVVVPCPLAKRQRLLYCRRSSYIRDIRPYIRSSGVTPTNPMPATMTSSSAPSSSSRL